MSFHAEWCSCARENRNIWAFIQHTSPTPSTAYGLWPSRAHLETSVGWNAPHPTPFLPESIAKCVPCYSHLLQFISVTMWVMGYYYYHLENKELMTQAGLSLVTLWVTQITVPCFKLKQFNRSKRRPSLFLALAPRTFLPLCHEMEQPLIIVPCRLESLFLCMTTKNKILYDDNISRLLSYRKYLSDVKRVGHSFFKYDTGLCIQASSTWAAQCGRWEYCGVADWDMPGSTFAACLS